MEKLNSNLHRLFITIIILLSSLAFLTGFISSNETNQVNGIWTGTVQFDENGTPFMIKIYEKPVHNYYGYVVMSNTPYTIAALDSYSLKDNKLILGSSVDGSKYELNLSESKTTIKGMLYNGTGDYSFQAPVTVKKDDKVPEWASKIKQILYKDGVYESRLNPTPYGHTPCIKIKVEKNRIVEVDYYEKNFKTGEYKDKNYGKEYLEAMGSAAYAGGQLSVIGGQTYPYRLVLSQRPENVDGVTGATSCLYRFKALVKKALKDAIIFEEK